MGLEENNATNVPQLHNAALKGFAGDFVRAATAKSEVHPAAVLISFLCMAGAYFGNKVHVRVGDDFHPPRIFVLKIGRSGKARKGMATGAIRRLVEQLNKVGMDLRVSNGPMSSGEGIVWNVRDASTDIDEKTGKPADAGVADKRLLIIESEFGAPLKGIKNDSNTLSAMLRSAWDHGNMEPLTKHNRVKATGAHVCIAGDITQGELQNLLTQTDTFNGFANRFLFVYIHRTRLEPNPQGLTDEQLEIFGRRLNAAIVSAHQRDEIKMSSRVAYWWEKRLYALISVETFGRIGAVTDRAEAQVIRLALIYALLDGHSEIRANHMSAALAVWRYCFESAHFVFGSEQSHSAAQKVLKALKTGPLTKTQISKMFNGHQSEQERDRLLKELEARAEIRISVRTSGGRPVSSIELVAKKA